MSVKFLTQQLCTYTDLYKHALQNNKSPKDREFLQKQIANLTNMLQETTKAQLKHREWNSHDGESQKCSINSRKMENYAKTLAEFVIQYCKLLKKTGSGLFEQIHNLVIEGIKVFEDDTSSYPEYIVQIVHNLRDEVQKLAQPTLVIKEKIVNVNYVADDADDDKIEAEKFVDQLFSDGPENDLPVAKKPSTASAAKTDAKAKSTSGTINTATTAGTTLTESSTQQISPEEIQNALDILLGNSDMDKPTIEDPDDEPSADGDSDGFVAVEDNCMLNLRQSRREAAEREQLEWQNRITAREQQLIVNGMTPKYAKELTRYELYPESIPRSKQDRERDTARENELCAQGMTKEKARLTVRTEAFYRANPEAQAAASAVTSFNDLVQTTQKDEHTESSALFQDPVKLNV